MAMTIGAPESARFVADLRLASEGLLFVSESDAPFEVVQWPEAPVPLTDAAIVMITGRSSTTPMQKTSLDEFFRLATQPQDWHGADEQRQVVQFQKLQALFNAQLVDTQVIKLGKIEIDVYIVGRLPASTSKDGWLGLSTRMVET